MDIAPFNNPPAPSRGASSRSPLAAGLSTFVVVALLTFLVEVGLPLMVGDDASQRPARAAQGAIALPIAVIAGALRFRRVRRRNRLAGAPWPWRAELYGLVALGGAAIPGVFGGAVMPPLVAGLRAVSRTATLLPWLGVLLLFALGAALAAGVVGWLRQSLAGTDPDTPIGSLASFGRLGYLVGTMIGLLAGATLY